MKKEELSHPLHRLDRTLGQRAADQFTRAIGNWTFMAIFILILILWVLTNLFAWLGIWDPYPFILLNLILSCIAAIQAPIILMSQNRQAQKEKLKLDYDYTVNKKAEKEIEELKNNLIELKEN